MRRILVVVCGSILFVSLTSAVPSQSKTQKKSHVVKLTPSTILEDLQKRSKSSPKMPAAELADYANRLLADKGFNYRFDVCDAFIPGARSEVRRPYTFTLLSGGKLTTSLEVSSPGESMCGECWLEIPSAQVTKREIVLLHDGKQTRLRRPPSFLLEEAQLVDSTLKRVLRTWQMPYQAIPIGISADGKKLYLGFYTDYELEGLALELSEDGSIAFRDRGKLQQLSRAEDVENAPKDPKNAYLSFLRFRVGDNSYTVRFSAPCT